MSDDDVQLYFPLPAPAKAKTLALIISPTGTISFASLDSERQAQAAAFTPAFTSEINFKEINRTSLSAVGERQGSRAPMSRVLLSQL